MKKNLIKLYIILLKNFSRTKIYLCLVLLFRKRGYLYDNGFIESWNVGYPISGNKMPIPWWPYSFTQFLTSRLKKEYKIFEYGSGNSTLFLGKYISNIVSVEHDSDWYGKLNLMINSNVNLKLYSEQDYVDSIGMDKYEIIIIDGIKRNECVIKAINNLSEDGIIIIDDTDRDEYNDSYKLLSDNTFKRIDFVGLGPCSLNANSTTIFYRTNNVLGI